MADNYNKDHVVSIKTLEMAVEKVKAEQIKLATNEEFEEMLESVFG